MSAHPAVELAPLGQPWKGISQMPRGMPVEGALAPELPPLRIDTQRDHFALGEPRLRTPMAARRTMRLAETIYSDVQGEQKGVWCAHGSTPFLGRDAVNSLSPRHLSFSFNSHQALQCHRPGARLSGVEHMARDRLAGSLRGFACPATRQAQAHLASAFTGCVSFGTP